MMVTNPNLSNSHKIITIPTIPIQLDLSLQIFPINTIPVLAFPYPPTVMGKS